jgi:hypothetical protein
MGKVKDMDILDAFQFAADNRYRPVAPAVDEFVQLADQLT